MDKLSFSNVVGFVLALAFALVIGVSMWALLLGDYVNSFMNEQTRHTLRIVGFAGALAALVTWWVQSFAAKRGFVVRTLFALFIFVVAFCSFGGLLEIHLYPRQLSEPAGLVVDRHVSRLAQRLLHIPARYVLAAPAGLCRSVVGRGDLCCLVRAARGQDRRYLKGSTI